MNRVIYCDQLSKHFGDQSFQIEVLNNINFSVYQGEMVAIVGASGSGKSTLLHLLGGLDIPSSGKVIVANHDLLKLSEKEKGQLRNRYLGFIYQFHHLLPEFNALENVAMPLLIGGVSPRKAIDRAKSMIDQVGLSHRHQHRVGELSGGERQRIAIARALVTRPKCVLADEPTGNLDHKTAEQIFDLMCQLNQEFDISFVIVTHNDLLASKLHRKLTLKTGSFSKDF